ncbi:hypothetical protein IAT40_006372 [Kwoniella sp. CBS 6097]
MSGQPSTTQVRSDRATESAHTPLYKFQSTAAPAEGKFDDASGHTNAWRSINSTSSRQAHSDATVSENASRGITTFAISQTDLTGAGEEDTETEPSTVGLHELSESAMSYFRTGATLFPSSSENTINSGSGGIPSSEKDSSGGPSSMADLSHSQLHSQIYYHILGGDTIQYPSSPIDDSDENSSLNRKQRKWNGGASRGQYIYEHVLAAQEERKSVPIYTYREGPTEDCPTGVAHTLFYTPGLGYQKGTFKFFRWHGSNFTWDSDLSIDSLHYRCTGYAGTAQQRCVASGVISAAEDWLANRQGQTEMSRKTTKSSKSTKSSSTHKNETQIKIKKKKRRKKI